MEKLNTKKINIFTRCKSSNIFLYFSLLLNKKLSICCERQQWQELRLIFLILKTMYTLNNWMPMCTNMMECWNWSINSKECRLLYFFLCQSAFCHILTRNCMHSTRFGQMIARIIAIKNDLSHRKRTKNACYLSNIWYFADIKHITCFKCTKIFSNLGI